MAFRVVSIATAIVALSLSVLPAQAALRSTYVNHALNATDLLTQHWYNETSGRFDTYWWQSASIISTLADLSLLEEQVFSNVHHYYDTTYRQAPSSNNGSWLNEYYDDEAWWALAWIKVYDMTQEQKYLDTAKALFEDMTTGLGSNCGGQWWSKDKTYTATVSNQLFFATASALANRVESKEEYQAYASGTLHWLQRSGLLTSNNTFLDGRDAMDGCRLVGPAWTYNQGVILGGLAEYYTLTKDRAVLNFAHRVAHGAIETLTDDNGILTEDGYPQPLNEDRAIFKGILMRNLAYLHAVSPDAGFVRFIQKNADTIWTKGRAKDGFVGPNWQGPLESPSVGTQAAAVDCFIAAVSVTTQDKADGAQTEQERIHQQRLLQGRAWWG